MEAENEDTELEEMEGTEGWLDVWLDTCDTGEALDADELVGSGWDGDGGQVNDDISDERGGGLLEEQPEVKHFTHWLMKELFFLLHKFHDLFLQDWESNSVKIKCLYESLKYLVHN